MRFAHAVVWMDHREARVAGFSSDHHCTDVILAVDAPRHLHRKSGPAGSGHAHPSRAFFDDIADALQGVDEILIAGPDGAKITFDRYLAERRPDVVGHVVAVETLDHPTDAQLLAHARAFMKRVDQLGRGGDRRVATDQER